jgi:hypothetical protein
MSDPTTSRTSRQDSNSRRPLFNSGQRRALMRMRSDSSYFKVYHDFMVFLNLSIEEAAVLGDMINVAEMTKAEHRDGWFDYTVEWMYKRTRLDRNPQQRVINVLKDAGWVEVRKFGNPARRQVRISVEAIENTIAEGLDDEGEPEIGSTTEPENVLTARPESGLTSNKEELRETPSGGVGGGKPRKNPPEKPPEKIDRLATNGQLLAQQTWGEEMADRMHRLATSQGHHPPYSRKKWAADFNRLRASLAYDEVSAAEKEVQRVFGWLEKNLATQKYPVTSVASFARRFEVLQSMSSQSRFVPPAPISEKDVDLPEELRDDLARIDWGVARPKGLDVFVAEALEDAKPLIARLKELSRDDNSPCQYEASVLLARLCPGGLGPASHRTVMAWVAAVAADVRKWRGWSGSLKGYEMRPGGRFFDKRVSELVKGRLGPLYKALES